MVKKILIGLVAVVALFFVQLATGGTMAGPGSSLHLNATVSVDPRTFTKKLSFNTPVTSAECSTYLFGNATRAAVCQPTGLAVAGKYRDVFTERLVARRTAAA